MVVDEVQSQILRAGYCLEEEYTVDKDIVYQENLSAVIMEPKVESSK